MGDDEVACRLVELCDAVDRLTIIRHHSEAAWPLSSKVLEAAEDAVAKANMRSRAALDRYWAGYGTECHAQNMRAIEQDRITGLMRKHAI